MTVLYSEPIMAWHWWFGLLLFIVIGISIFMIILPCCNFKQWRLIMMTIVTSLILCIIALFIIGFKKLYQFDTGRKKYEVILDDEYSADDLYDEYNVIDKRGLIWILEDKKEGTD